MTGKARITKDVEVFTGKLKEIVLFKALHLVLSDKSCESVAVIKFLPLGFLVQTNTDRAS
jgi:hypothetical protein